jgi:hypothetical protein
MNNKHVQDQLSTYLDNRLSLDEATHVKTHLQTCLECEKVYKELSAMIGWMKKVPKPAHNFGLETRLVAKMKGQLNKTVLPRFSWTTISGGVATALVAIFLLITVRENPLDNQVPHQFRQEEIPIATQGRDRIDDRKIIAPKTDPPQIPIGQKKAHRLALAPSKHQEVTFAPQSVNREADVASEYRNRSYDISAEAEKKFKSGQETGFGSAATGGVASGVAGGVAFNESFLRANNKLSKKIPPPLYSEYSRLTCDITEPEKHVIRNQEEWEFLLKHMGLQLPAQIFPSVDFSEQMVVAVFMGEQTSGGYSIHIIGEEYRNTTTGKVLIVKIQEKRPDPELAVITMITQPYHLKLLPLFTGPVEFEKMK